MGSLLYNSIHKWNRELLHRTFRPEMAWKVASIPLLPNPHKDRTIWKGSRDARFSIKNAYWCANNGCWEGEDSLCKLLWKSKLEGRLKFLLSRVANNCLPTGEKLACISGNHTWCCSLCGDGVDSVLHIFLYCPFSRLVWFGSRWNLTVENLVIRNPKELVRWILDLPHILLTEKDLC